MTRGRMPQPTATELQFLQALWDLGPCTVRQIHERVVPEKGINYSTTVKMLRLMLEKGLVKRDEASDPLIYRAVLTREKAGKTLVRNLINRVYNGSAMALVLQALSTGRATREERDEVRRLLDEMES